MFAWSQELENVDSPGVLSLISAELRRLAPPEEQPATSLISFCRSSYCPTTFPTSGDG